jgi:CheY-like chemotaxis protein
MPKILLVEDDLADQKLVKASIAAVNQATRVSTAESGEVALELLRLRTDEGDSTSLPDLILLDLNMPGMGGREFLRRLKCHETLRQIPVVVLTSSKSERDISESYLLQAAGYLHKPPSLQDLKVLMAGLEQYWFSLCKLPSRERYAIG